MYCPAVDISNEFNKMTIAIWFDNNNLSVNIKIFLLTYKQYLSLKIKNRKSALLPFEEQ